MIDEDTDDIRSLRLQDAQLWVGLSRNWSVKVLVLVRP